MTSLEVASTPRPAVIGVGNPLCGDDGIGIKLVQDLELQIYALGADPIDGGTGGATLLALLEDRPLVIFLDAVRMGLIPGEVSVFSPGEVNFKATEIASVHDFDLTLVLRLLSRTSPFTKVCIIGVQPATTRKTFRLSARLRDAYPSIRDAVETALRDALARFGTQPQ